MAYDTTLAELVRHATRTLRGVTEKQMFGGLAFLLDGKMFVGVSGNELMVRVGPERHDEALRNPNVRIMDFTGRPMRGYVFVAPAGLQDEPAIDRWIRWSSEFVAGLPAKPAPKGAAPDRTAVKAAARNAPARKRRERKPAEKGPPTRKAATRAGRRNAAR